MMQGRKLIQISVRLTPGLGLGRLTPGFAGRHFQTSSKSLLASTPYGSSLLVNNGGMSSSVSIIPSLQMQMMIQNRFFSRKTGSTALEPAQRPLSKKQQKRKRKRDEMRSLQVDPKSHRIKNEFMRKQFGSMKTKDFIEKTGKG